MAVAYGDVAVSAVHKLMPKLRLKCATAKKYNDGRHEEQQEERDYAAVCFRGGTHLNMK